MRYLHDEFQNNIYYSLFTKAYLFPLHYCTSLQSILCVRKKMLILCVGLFYKAPKQEMKNFNINIFYHFGGLLYKAILCYKNQLSKQNVTYYPSREFQLPSKFILCFEKNLLMLPCKLKVS